MTVSPVVKPADVSYGLLRDVAFLPLSPMIIPPHLIIVRRDNPCRPLDGAMDATHPEADTITSDPLES